MNKSPKNYRRVVGVRLTETDTNNLDSICAALGVTRSEFVRRKIENINSTIMKNKDIFNISEGPATDAWGRKTETLQHQKEENEKEVMDQVEAIMNPPAESQLKEVKKTLPKPAVKTQPATSIFNVKGHFSFQHVKFNMYIEAANKEKAIAKAESFHKAPVLPVTVDSITIVTAASVRGKKIYKA